MGVPGLFVWLIKQYKENKLVLNTLKTQNRPQILYIDSNCLFHPQCFKILEALPDEERVEKLEKKMIARILNYIEYLIGFVNPEEMVYISVDGPAPLAKIDQQRKRRFRTIDDNKLRDKIKKKHNKKVNNVWNNTVITPGTIFMEHLHNAIDEYCKLNKSKIKIIYSSYHTPGEGEHKILQHIKKNKLRLKDKSLVIYGLDADLFFLAIASHIQNIYLLREESQLSEKTKKKTGLFEYFDPVEDVAEELRYISINIVKKCYNEQINNIINNKLYGTGICDEKTTVDFCDDFIVLCYLLGNDFLPHLPSIDIKKSGLDIVLDCYADIYIMLNQKLINTESIDDKDRCEINTIFLLELMKQLGDQEYDFFTEIVPTIKNKMNKRFCYAQDNYGKEIWKMENLKSFDIHDPVKLGEGNVKEWKFRYYEHYFNTIEYQKDTIDEICTTYLEGLAWVTKYYFDDCPDWRWQYTYTHAPFISDIYNYLKTTNFDINKIKFKDNKSLSPCVQLLAVLPPHCKDNIPLAYRHLVESKDSPIIDMFPIKIELDMINKDQYWQCIPLIPVLDVQRIESAVDKIKSKLSKEEKIRDTILNDIIY
jgi:5'-3' exonuclease